MKREIFSSDVRLREEGGRTIVGTAILFNTPSLVLWGDDSHEAREIIAPEAVTRELLDRSDIKFTIYHNRERILARSNCGKGTLSYNITARGVEFEFEAPATVDGDMALELVRRGDIAGCSFAFTADYSNREKVSRQSQTVDGVEQITYTVREITGIFDFTLAADPAYPQTSVATREQYEGPAAPPAEVYDAAEIARIREIANIKLITEL